MSHSSNCVSVEDCQQRCCYLSHIETETAAAGIFSSRCFSRINICPLRPGSYRFTWYCLCPAHDGHQLSFPELVEAGEQGGGAVRLGGVVPRVNHGGLDGLQDGEQGEAGAHSWGDA